MNLLMLLASLYSFDNKIAIQQNHTNNGEIPRTRILTCAVAVLLTNSNIF